jgi:hypothetical protein
MEQLTIEMLIDRGEDPHCFRCKTREITMDDLSDGGDFVCETCCEELDAELSGNYGREMPSWDCGR